MNREFKYKPVKKRKLHAPSIIDEESRSEWLNPLDTEDIKNVLKKTWYKNGMHNGYVGAMRLALSLLVQMMGDKNPIVAMAAALNLMRSDGYAGLLGIPSIKMTIRKIKENIQELEEKQKAAEKAAAAELPPAPDQAKEAEKVDDPLNRAILEQLEREEKNHGGARGRAGEGQED